MGLSRALVLEIQEAEDLQGIEDKWKGED